VLALSVRQPYAELILRGIKTVEYRTRPTRIIGRRFHIYAPRKRASADLKVWSRDLGVPADALPAWMIELAEQVGMLEDLRSAELRSAELRSADLRRADPRSATVPSAGDLRSADLAVGSVALRRRLRSAWRSAPARRAQLGGMARVS
jgi:hypothetical protein